MIFLVGVPATSWNLLWEFLGFPVGELKTETARFSGNEHDLGVVDNPISILHLSVYNSVYMYRYIYIYTHACVCVYIYVHIVLHIYIYTRKYLSYLHILCTYTPVSFTWEVYHIISMIIWYRYSMQNWDTWTFPHLSHHVFFARQTAPRWRGVDATPRSRATPRPREAEATRGRAFCWTSRWGAETGIRDGTDWNILGLLEFSWDMNGIYWDDYCCRL